VNELQELYREVILDHNRHPRNFGELDDADRMVAGVNPLCGDKMTLYLKLDGDRIADVRFQGTGCAISVASSSLMTERVKGLTRAEALALYHQVHDMLTGRGTEPPPESLDKLAALAGVREYPSRVKCASLAWHALDSALEGAADTVTTE
jgi:nitrogen fixation protein NifU and related proteins